MWFFKKNAKKHLNYTSYPYLYEWDTVVHWNIGGRKWENKMSKILALLENFNPDFCFISEANISANLCDHEALIPDWQRMTPEVVSIWIKVGGRGGSSTLIGGVYREQYLIHYSAPANSDNAFNQTARWKKYINQWKNAARIKSCWVVGDLNLDVLKWNSTDYHLESMVNMVKMDIETDFFFCSQLVQGPTRFWPNIVSSLIDHVWTNVSEKAIIIKNIA